MGYIYVDGRTQLEMLEAYRQYKLEKSIRMLELQNKKYEKLHNSKHINSEWICNATPPSMKKKRKSLLEAVFTFDHSAIKDAMSYHSTKNLTGFEKISGDLHNAAVAMYNPIAARELLQDKYGFLYG